MTKMLIATAAAATLLLGTAALAQDKLATGSAELKNAAGDTIGTASFTAAPTGVLVRIEAKGLTPGWHGLHFHEKGDCSKSDFTSAGAHTHGAAKAVHGLLNREANETGDLPNLYADMHGGANGEFFSTLTTLAALKDADGSALVVHASPDDHSTQPIGGAGARVACGVIR